MILVDDEPTLFYFRTFLPVYYLIFLLDHRRYKMNLIDRLKYKIFSDIRIVSQALVAILITQRFLEAQLLEVPIT